MKKLTFLLFVICVTSLSAQKNRLDIGIAAGPSGNHLYGYDKIPQNKTNPLIAFSAGVTIQYNLPKLLSIVSGIFYEKKGEKFSGYVSDHNGLQVPFKQKYFYNYITLPVLARFSFGKKTLFFAEGGGFASYLLNSYINVTGIPVNYQNGSTTASYKRLDAGVSIGLGLSVPLGEKLLLSVEVRDNLGLLNISEFPVYKDKFIKTNSTNLLVGLAYRLGKRSA
jgi:outer membrane protein with beta-barrel domain